MSPPTNQSCQPPLTLMVSSYAYNVSRMNRLLVCRCVVLSSIEDENWQLSRGLDDALGICVLRRASVD